MKMNQFDNQWDEPNELASTEQEMLMLPCDQRYRTSHYFLADQLRCSEALSDFRSVRALLRKVANLNPLEAFQQHFEAIPVRIEPQ